MQDPAQQRKLYGVLAVVFGVAAVAWFIGGFLSRPMHYISYPLIALINGGISWYCKQMAR